MTEHPDHHGRLGDFLVEHHYLTSTQLRDALTEQKRTGHQLGRVLIDNGCVSEEQIASCIAEQLGLALIDLHSSTPAADSLCLLTEPQARRFGALVLEDRGRDLLVGMVDPTDLNAQDQLSALLGRAITVVVLTQGQFSEAIDRCYPKPQHFNELALELEHEVGRGEGVIQLNQLKPGSALDAPVIKLLQNLFDEADRVRASDIHIEPQERKLLVRFRIDGALSSQLDADPRVHSALLVRLKLLAELDIAEHRLPQDGRFAVRTARNRIDVRLSTLPTQYGEAAVMRLLIQSSVVSDLDATGMRVETLAHFRQAISAPFGMVLVTGPTGSGKSTTLYCALQKLNQPDVKILTCEDPVEYRIAGISQVQINEKINLSFSRVLRAFLRQDPDILLVGEIRDQETAEISARAAMTGHLVLSTLHTNDAISTPARLLDLGLPSYMIASSLLCVLSQRLVRLLCERCAKPYEPLPGEIDWLRQQYGELPARANWRTHAACPHCNGTGYRGRTAVHELLRMTPELSSALHQGDNNLFERLARAQMGAATLGRHAIALALEGRTTVTEAMQIVGAVYA